MIMTRLRAARLSAGFSQRALARRAGISARTVERLEAGLGRPHQETSRRILEALEVPWTERGRIFAPELP